MTLITMTVIMIRMIIVKILIEMMITMVVHDGHMMTIIIMTV